MRVKSFMPVFLAGAAMLVVAGCASEIQPPRVGTDHPANPDAPAAPVAPPAPALAASKNPEPDYQTDAPTQGMDHGSMQGMAGMNHGAMQPMQGMDHDSMKSMNPESMKGMQHGKAPADKGANNEHGQ